MSEYIIEEFSVKPSGVFASTRYKRVLVDELGNITNTGVPGKEEMNLPCTYDYKKVNRAYTQGQLITEFCNFVTFTHYRVYAQDCVPFAYVQTDINFPACGYMVPLPTPAVPPNPFGTAVYGAYKTFDYCDIDGGNKSVVISKKDYIGAVVVIENGAKDPVVYTYKNNNDYKFNTIRSRECELTIINMVDFQASEFYTIDERAFKLEIFDEGVLEFAGFIIPDSCQELFDPAPYPVTLVATDTLGALQKVTYPLPIGSSIDIRQNFKDILCYALSATNLGLDIHTICNLYEKKMDNSLNDDPLTQASVNPLRMTEKNTTMTCYQAIDEVCKVFGAYLAQIDGAWYFIRTSELSDEVIRERVYNNTGLFLRAGIVENGRVAGAIGQEVVIEQGASIRIGNAYKRAVIDLEYGTSPARVYNGDFEDWDGQNFRYWTKYGNVDISRIQKSVTGSGGAQIPVNDYACQFNVLANNGKWLEANPIQVYQGDKLTFSFEFFFQQISYFLPIFKIRIKIGNYYLYVPYGPGDPEWVQQLATASIYFLINPAVLSSYAYFPFELTLPEIPETGQMVIQIFGAENAVTGYGTTYSQLSFDNISISKSQNNNTNEPIGTFFTSQQLGFYTETPDITKIIFGDYIQQLIATRPQRNQNSVQIAQNNLYAIYTKDGSYSTQWYEYSQIGSQLPIGQLLAKSIVKAYQRPYRFIDCVLKGDNLKYSDVFNFIVPTSAEFTQKTFAYSSVRFSSKFKTSEGTLIEIFNKPIKTIDVQTPNNGGQDPPPFTQNPNNPLPLSGTGIFTPEFTPEFI